MAQTEHQHLSFTARELLPGKHYLRIIPKGVRYDSNWDRQHASWIFESFDSLFKLFWCLYVFFQIVETDIRFLRVSIDKSVLFLLSLVFLVIKC